MFYIRHALTLIYTVLFVLLICGLCVTLFQSPPIHVSNLMGSRIVHFENKAWGLSQSLNNAIPGANVEIGVKVTMWSVSLDLVINVSYYGYENQVVHQKYNMEDLPCKAFVTSFRTAQIFGVLSVFTSFFCLVLVISNFFSRLFLPVLWVMTWLNVVCVSTTCSMLLKLLFEPSCFGEDAQIPPFMQLAVPEGGFAMYLICMCSYLITSVMTVFL